MPSGDTNVTNFHNFGSFFESLHLSYNSPSLENEKSAGTTLLGDRSLILLQPAGDVQRVSDQKIVFRTKQCPSHYHPK